MNISRAGVMLLILVTAALASEPVLSRGGSGLGGRSGHHSGAGTWAQHSGVRQRGRLRIFVGGVVGAPAFWPWWDYPPYVYAPDPVYYIEQGDETVPPAAEWLYCPALSTYFPYIMECPGGWQRVAPQLPSGEISPPLQVTPDVPNGPASS
jgi:hypothetical protein